jgi:hypothetical protein
MPSSRNLQPLAVVAEVRHLREEIEQRVARIFELTDTLYNSVRRGNFRLERDRIEADIQLLQSRLEQSVRRGEPTETRQQLQAAVDGAQTRLAHHQEVTPVYLAFANTWKRFAGSMHQGLLRTASVDRVIEQVHRKQGLTEEASEQKPEPSKTPESTIQDLVELYGDDVDES